MINFKLLFNKKIQKSKIHFQEIPSTYLKM